MIDSNLSHSSLQILLAWQQKPNVVKSKAIPEEVGALSKERFDVGDFVLLEQYSVKAPDCLPLVSGKNLTQTCFVVERFSEMLLPNTSMSKINCRWVLEKGVRDHG